MSITAADIVKYIGANPLAPVITDPTTYELAILNGLQSKQVYQGTVPGHVIAARRATNKRARLARRANR
jgi:hypothetical protein